MTEAHGFMIEVRTQGDRLERSRIGFLRAYRPHDDNFLKPETAS